MYFGRVVGSVWATIKSPQMVGQRMLVVQPLTPELKNTGKPLICTDSIGAGAGELVYWVRRQIPRCARCRHRPEIRIAKNFSLSGYGLT